MFLILLCQGTFNFFSPLSFSITHHTNTIHVKGARALAGKQCHCFFLYFPLRYSCLALGNSIRWKIVTVRCFSYTTFIDLYHSSLDVFTTTGRNESRIFHGNFSRFAQVHFSRSITLKRNLISIFDVHIFANKIDIKSKEIEREREVIEWRLTKKTSLLRATIPYHLVVAGVFTSSLSFGSLFGEQLPLSSVYFGMSRATRYTTSIMTQTTVGRRMPSASFIAGLNVTLQLSVVCMYVCMPRFQWLPAFTSFIAHRS